MAETAYPWYHLVTGDSLEQGEFLEAFPVFRPPPELDSWEEASSAFFEFEDRDVVVVSQTCDLVKGREKLSEVLLCPIWDLSNFAVDNHLATAKGREEARRGQLPSVHSLAKCELPGVSRTVRVVDFRQVFSLPLGFARHQAEKTGKRLRLGSPYREHLAQAFARFFMRIGLPLDIPPFR